MKNFFGPFLEGFGYIFGIFPERRMKPKSQREMDELNYKAMKGDWEAVGNDMRKVMGMLDKELKKKP
jgi:hypothetical protein